MKHNLVLGFLILNIILAGCKSSVTYKYTEGKIYGTFYHISYASEEDLQEEIRRQMESVNASLSMFNPNSVIAKLNRNESDSTDILFRKLFNTALQVYQATDGAFDITVGPLVNAWGFGVKQNTFPDSARIDSIVRFVGMEKLALVNDKIQKKFPEIEMDASSIAKGLGVDLVAELLDSRGIKDYMVEIGGELRVKGFSNKKRAWRIGIDRPVDDVAAEDRQLQFIVGLTSGALATSGNYRNFYIHEGKKYAHTINPKTGYPVQTEILSASVYARTCMESDAYATAFMVMGLQKSRQILQADPELEACFIYTENGKLKTWESPGFKKLIIQEAPEE